MPEKNYYKILQIDPSAEPEVVQAAYRRLAQKYHPDANNSADATHRMQEINAAYEVLNNPVKRAVYDLHCEEEKAARYESKNEQEPRQPTSAWQSDYDLRQRQQAEAHHRAESEKRQKEQAEAQRRPEYEQQQAAKTEAERKRQATASKTEAPVPPAAKLTRTQFGIIIAIVVGVFGIAVWLADIALRTPLSTSVAIVTPTIMTTKPPRPTNTPGPKVPDTIAKGVYVVVINGVNFRKDANTTAWIIRTLDQGEVLEVIGGPTSANDLTWWQLRDPLGSEGWSAQDYLKPTVPPVPAPTITPSRSLSLTQVSDKDGMTLLYIPAGEFTMGSNVGESDEKPPRTVYLDAYYIDQTEVTNVMFKKFIDATGYQTDADKLGSGYAFDATAKSWSDTKGVNWQHPRGSSSNLNGFENHPVVQVSWNDATAYCHWAGGDLPTEAQWEKAARGDDKRTYPWGNQAPDKWRLNYSMEVGDTTQVGAYPTGASFYGALDMAGNIWEWVQDWYDKNYYVRSPARNPENTTKSDARALRGGGWGDAASRVRASVRYWVNPVYRDGNFGFRCAR